MRFVLAFIFALSLVVQTVYPSVECGVAVGCCCLPETHAAGEEESVEQSCCGLPANTESAQSGCLSQHGEAVADHGDCPCCEQAPENAVPVVSIDQRDLNPLFHFNELASLPLLNVVDVPERHFQTPADDKTRPGRHVRCHLLDCVWLL